mmetsp:Transcript_1611/g.2867  ORF Transcript_1611/g.2867 Transcript_1611/m.2867 type:complete len:251 (-) Transcript_1611:673-1425(-)
MGEPMHMIWRNCEMCKSWTIACKCYGTILERTWFLTNLWIMPSHDGGWNVFHEGPFPLSLLGSMGKRNWTSAVHPFMTPTNPMLTLTLSRHLHLMHTPNKEMKMSTLLAATTSTRLLTIPQIQQAVVAVSQQTIMCQLQLDRLCNMDLQGTVVKNLQMVKLMESMRTNMMQSLDRLQLPHLLLRMRWLLSKAPPCRRKEMRMRMICQTPGAPLFCLQGSIPRHIIHLQSTVHFRVGFGKHIVWMYHGNRH